MRMIKKKPFDRKAKILLAAIIGAIFIIPFFPLATKKAWVYTNKPEFCISCHTMEKEYRNWTHSSHRNWAGCSDCHVPHNGIMMAAAGKTRDGINHGYAYLLNKDPVLIRISKHGGDTVMSNCLRCHEQLVANIVHEGDRKCWECHRGIAHGY